MAMPDRSDRIANVAIVLAALAIVWVAVSKAFESSGRATMSPKYEAGDRFQPIPGIDPAAASSTLVVWVRSSCHFCTESMAFYRELIQRRHETRIVVAGHESQEVLREYVSKSGIQPDAIFSVGERHEKLNATPSLVLIDSHGTVRSAWRGKLTSEEEQRLLSQIN